MTANRFELLIINLRFEDKIRQETDKLSFKRELWNTVSDNCRLKFEPGA